jgi:hypothetical protein
VPTKNQNEQISDNSHKPIGDLSNYSTVELSKLLLSGDRKQVLFASSEIDVRLNRGEIKNIGKKYEIYLSSKKSKDIFVIARMAEILARMPLDSNIELAAKKDLNSQDVNNFIGGYKYMVKFDEKFADAQVKYTSYKDIPILIRQFLYNAKPIVKLRNQWINETLKKFLTWQSSGTRDEPNPYRKILLEESHYVIDYVLVNPSEYGVQPIPLGLIYLLGEIGDTRTFELLLQAYHHDANFRTAISLGACVGPLCLESMFNGFKKKEKEIFIESILTSEEYDKLKTYSNEELIKYWKEHWYELKQKCMQRSVPILG